MTRSKPCTRVLLSNGAGLTEQGDDDDEVFLLLNGVVAVEVDGTPIADVGPGAILGERAALEGGVRTSTLQALTAVTVAVAEANDVDTDALAELSTVHRREQARAD